MDVDLMALVSNTKKGRRERRPFVYQAVATESGGD